MTRKWNARAVGLFLTFSSAGLTAAGPVRAPEPVPTFAKDVAPILFGRCAGCHRPGEVAPMALLSYEDARPWARAIKAKVVDREMPPWGADPRYGIFKDARSLSEREIRTVAEWVDAGAPRGDDRDMPPLPQFPTGWTHSNPDYVFELPIDVQIPSEGQLDLQYFWVPIPFAEDRFAQMVEIRPSNPAVLHHARADVVALPEGARIVGGKLMSADGRTGSPRGDDRATNRPAVDPFDFARSTLISFIPGGGLEEHPIGTGKRIEAGKYVRFEMHYTPSGKPETDRTRIGVWFSKAPVTHEVFTVLNPRTLVPGATNAVA
jgi:mono/diheme cytochrome c family protein